ncbi:MAG: hypothetical protein U1A78_32125 [Polyangia bacterium]
MDYLSLSAPKVLIARFLLEARLSSPGSISGHQVEQAKLGMGGRPPDGGRVNVQEVLRARLADLLLLCRDLNKDEERVCRCRYGTTAGAELYTAIRRLCDLREGDGEDVADMNPRDPGGAPMTGYVAVTGQRGRFPNYEEIGRQLGLTAVQVRTLLYSARAKIATAIKWRAFAAAQEAAYE